MEKGDFTNLADDYSKYRPSYNKEVIDVILNFVGKNIKIINAVDIGAGTGIFTKCLTEAGIRKVLAIEPNREMRRAGVKFLNNEVNFIDGSAEETGLQSDSFDLVTMASSFHWPKTADALKEIDRILCSDGIFSAIWNPRLTDRSVVESEVQEILSRKYHISSRVSSGLSGITLELREILTSCQIFRSVIYVDAIDVVHRSHEEYIGAWRSVNDIQNQLGKDNFAKFIDDVAKIITNYPSVEVHYLTRAWIARK